MSLDPEELELRRKTYAWIRGKYLEDEDAVEAARARGVARREQAPAALALLEPLRVTGDLATFRTELDHMTSQSSSRLSLSGPNGQMVVNQLASLAPDPVFAGKLLAEALAVPADEAAASDAITRVVAYFDEIRTGNRLHAGRVPPLLSVFWTLADRETWPAMWASAGTAFEQLGWTFPTSPAERYLAFRRMVLDLGPAPDVLDTLLWFSERTSPGLDPTTRHRVARGWQLKEAGRDMDPVAYTNADSMLATMRRAGDDLAPRISEALDRPVTKRMAPRARVEGGEDRARYDAFVTWSSIGRVDGWVVPPSIRLWCGRDGILLALHPGYREKGWIDHARRNLAESLPAGLELLDYYRVESSAHAEPTKRDFFIGRFIPYDDVEWSMVGTELETVAARASTIYQRLLTQGPGWSAGPDESDGIAVDTDDDGLAALFEEFVADHGYPTQEDEDHRAARESLAAPLAEKLLDRLDIATFRRILNTHKYGFAGNRSILNTTLASADEEATLALVLDVTRDLLYGDGDFAERLDRCPDRLKGLGQAGAMKLLALVYPERFLPIYPLLGASGKLALLPSLGITEVPEGSLGERAVAANDLMRARMASIPALADDPWGQMVFSYWLRDHASATPDPPEEIDLDTLLAEATEACTLPPDSEFLRHLVDLLDDKGQIVLYGPPGTGKTYLALELARAIAPDEERRALVQFHPSMAYEDFMEGFRPVLREGGLTYELVEGPLIELANRAATDDRPHVLVIDEMNRANLPKVFGELLFLLEYRDHPVKLAYRVNEDEFALPKNLWIIGTMNLADRSVGQIDAAMRRRFAFVPFTPNDDENGGLLRRWLEKRHHPTWPADIVDEVNSELEIDLGHSDLLIGPSYFMKEALDEHAMARIWRYAIEPLMSDLFHGDDALVKKYTWASVAKRHAASMPGADEIDDGVEQSVENDEPDAD